MEQWLIVNALFWPGIAHRKLKMPGAHARHMRRRRVADLSNMQK